MWFNHNYWLLPEEPVEQKPVPVVYGYAKLVPTPIHQAIGSFGEIDGESVLTSMDVWFAVCMGKVSYVALRGPGAGYRDLSGADPITNYFTHVSVGDPTAPSAPTGLVNSRNQPLLYVNGLKGVAHLYLAEHLSPGWNSVFGFGSSENAIEELKELLIYVRRDLSTCPVQPADIEGGASTPGGFYGSNPASVIYDILTNEQWGLGIPAGDIDLESFTYAASHFDSKDYGINLVLNKIASGKNIISKICAMVGARLVVDIDDKLRLVALNSTRAITPVVTLVDADFSSFSYTTQSWEDTYNQFIAKYTQPYNADEDGVRFINFEERALAVENPANILLVGSTHKLDLDLTYFYDVLAASQRLHEIMKDHSIPRTTIKATVNESMFEFVGGDAVSIINTEHNIAAVFRIKNKSINTQDNTKIDLTLEQLSEALYDENFTQAGESFGESLIVDQRLSEDVTLAAYSDTSATTANAYASYPDVRISIVYGPNPDDREAALVTQYQDPVNYSAEMVDQGGGKFKIKLWPPAAWASFVEYNSTGQAYFKVWESA
jgi:hypothetical protein